MPPGQDPTTNTMATFSTYRLVASYLPANASNWARLLTSGSQFAAACAYSLTDALSITWIAPISLRSDSRCSCRPTLQHCTLESQCDSGIIDHASAPYHAECALALTIVRVDVRQESADSLEKFDSLRACNAHASAKQIVTIP